MQSTNLRESAKTQIVISKNELRQLVHWAVWGVGKAKAGSYQDSVIETIQKYGRSLGMASYKNLHFGELLPKKRTPNAKS